MNTVTYSTAYSTTVYDGYGFRGVELSTQTGGVSPHRDKHPEGTRTQRVPGGQWGYYTDFETGLLCLTNRYYDPGTARFLTRDPIGYEGGINLYGFCAGNPINKIDPFGTDWETGSYLSDVGQVFLGYGDSLIGLVRSPYDLAVFAGTYADNPTEGARTFGSGLWHSFTDWATGTGNLRNQGASFSNFLILATPTAKKIPAHRNSGWTLPRSGGGAFINGRWYTEHALERMAPATPQVMAELTKRTQTRATRAGIATQTAEWKSFWNNKGPHPRGVPPMVVEAEIKRPGSTNVKVITGRRRGYLLKRGVVTVIPKGE